MTQDSARARVGVVGCGATAQLNHLPALGRLGLRPEVVVDAEPSRAREVGERFGAARHTSDLAEAAELIDRAVVATPPGSHAPIAETLLAEGIHVLLEKPMATSGEEGRRIAAAAEASGSVVCVGLTRRHWHASRWLAAFMDAGARAEVEFFDWREGFGFGWPAETDYFIRNDDGGGGALLDMGSHTVDLMLMWFGEVARFSYFDDNFGGVEADCEIHLTTKAGAAGFVELSRTRQLRSSVLIQGRGWRIEVPDVYANELRAQPSSVLRQEFVGLRGDRLPAQTLPDLYVSQLEHFFAAIARGAGPAETLGDAIASLDLMSACYASRRPLELSWVGAAR
jgi:predicted dehydrogenase